MIRAVVAKTFRDSRWMLLLLLAAILIFEVLFVFAIRNAATDVVKMWQKFPFVLRMMSALLGADLSRDISVTALVTIGFAHPFVYATTWAFLLTLGTRVVAAEIDRGTADLLLALPISRAGLYCAVSGVWLAWTIPISLAPWLGVTLGVSRFPLDEPLNHERLRLVVVNFAALYVCIGCLTMWASSAATRRGSAVGVMLGILLFSFVWNFLVALLPWGREVPTPIEGFRIDLGWLGLLNYYRPLEIVRVGAVPWADLLTLLGIAAAAWIAGLVHFCRRDIPAA